MEAYSNSTNGRLNFAAARHFMSTYDTSSVVPQELRSFAHKKAKDEIEVFNLRQKASNTTPLLDGDVDGPFDKNKKGKSGQRGKKKPGADDDV